MFKLNAKLLVFLAVVLILLSGAALSYVFFSSSRPSLEITYVQFCEENDTDCHEENLPYQNPALPVEERVADLLDRMTIAEKIGQMALVEKNSIHDLNDIAKYGLGALLSGGGAKPDNNTSEGWLEMVKNFQSYSQKTRLKIPLLYGVDANHGHSNVPGATIFPHFIGLGAAKNADLVYEVAKATAEEAAATGIYWVFSPNIDVVQDLRWGRTYEIFSSDVKTVSVLGKAYIEGLQSSALVAGSAKHYIGQGSMKWGSSANKDFLIDQGNSDIAEEELRKNHLEPFKEAVKADVKSIMVGLSNWNGEKISSNKYLLTDVLKNELGFEGFIFSDWYGVYQNEKDEYGALVRDINAGVDMIMLPFEYENFSTYMHRALAEGDLDLKRINDAVKRILKAKFEIGLFDNVKNSPFNLKIIGSKAHREIAREAVRESLVLLKNDNIVPIVKNNLRILVAGSAANNLGKQCGGWTVEWQGIDGNWIPGTTILEGIKKTVSSGTALEYDLNGDFNKQDELADIGIAVVGENPYAEGWGDNENPRLSAEDINAIYNLKKKSQKIVVIIISGRPLDIKEYIKDWDAVIAAWLPGSEGGGVADVLFGEYPFMGTLPVMWDL